MPLQSDLFRGDARLESALINDAAHVKQGDRGEFVTKIQTALNQIMNAGLAADGAFGPATARAVLAYKRSRNIINRAYQTQPDDIVGRMTVAALDGELANQRPAVVPVVIIGKPNVHRRAIRSGESVTGTQTVHLSAVVRGNPYLPANAKPHPLLPASVPPGKSYQVPVTIEPALTGGDVVDFRISGSDIVNGTAVIKPDKLSGSGFVTVTGGVVTDPGKGGNLRIEASLNGSVLAVSEPFTVCAHPVRVRCKLKGELFEPGGPGLLPRIGMEVRVELESDSGANSDLTFAFWTESVEEFPPRDIPPFGKETNVLQTGDFIPCVANVPFVDQHGERAVFPGKAGKKTLQQVYVYKCTCCGATGVPIPFSGFEIVSEVRKVGADWMHNVTKTATKTGTIAPFRVSAAAGDLVPTVGKKIVSKDHKLPVKEP